MMCGVDAINYAAEAWGLRCLRYEIRDIQLPTKVKEAMQMQVSLSCVDCLEFEETHRLRRRGRRELTSLNQRVSGQYGLYLST